MYSISMAGVKKISLTYFEIIIYYQDVACCFCVPVFLTVLELFNSQDWDALDFLHDIEHEKHYSILRLMNFVQCAKIITFV